MKTQLFLDLQESGSAPAPPKPPSPASAPPAPPAPSAPRNAPVDAAVPRQRPAVWHGPGAQRGGDDAAMQRADAGTMQRAPDTAARGLGVAIESWADRAAQSRPPAPAAARPMPQPEPAIEARALPARPARQDEIPSLPMTGPATVQAPGHARPDLPHPRVDAGPAGRPEPFVDDDVTIPRAPSAVDEADWLAARLRADPAQRKAPAWRNKFRMRRLAAWSIAGGLLAGVAAGGLWLYEENRGDGAPVVAAKTAPAGMAPAAAKSGAQASAAPEAVAPVSPPAVQPATTTNIVRPVPDLAAAPAVPVSPAPGVADGRTVKTVETASAQAAHVEPPERAPRQAVTARKRPDTKTARARSHATPPAAPVAAERSARQRREELLMQCRAHGYDERRCFQRACTMTRYGLACRG